MLENSILKLRALEPEDIDWLYKWENDAKLWHLSNTTKPFSRYVLEQYILNSHLDICEYKQLRLMIVLKKGKKEITIGCIDIFDFDSINLRAGVGLFITEEYRGKGIASQAIDLLVNYSKNMLHLHQLYCTITQDNESSIKAFEKAGFTKSGNRFHWVRKEDKWLDENFYQLILKTV
jgi:diamine N-acetyltransferase